MTHWIQLETKPEGQATAHNFIDLTLISRVHVRKLNQQLAEINVVYGNQVNRQAELLQFTGTEAASFLTQWRAFLGENLKHQDPEATPGTIHIPSIQDSALF